jgi:hypothetical protein
MPDLAMILAPFTVERIERALRRLRVAALFDGSEGIRRWTLPRFVRAPLPLAR